MLVIRLPPVSAPPCEKPPAPKLPPVPSKLPPVPVQPPPAPLKLPPDKYILRQIHRGGRPEKVGLDETVDFAKHGIEKFKTMPCNAKDGGREQ